MLLNVNNLYKSFGGVKATNNISIKADDHQIISIIGPNGAGKTTFFNLLSGVYKPDHGEIIFNGENITGMDLNAITHKGIARTFQNIRLFKGLTVLENVLTSCDPTAKYGIFDALLNTPRRRRIDKENGDACIHYLELVGLQDYQHERPENLPYGLQRKLELARALATRPKLLLLDEPAAGLNPSEVRGFVDLIIKLHQENDFAILIIEHRMAVVNELSQWVYVFNFGEMLAEGTPTEIQNNPDVIKAYIGEEN
jgi:branched-chain amino acid transport system ATP-binding protein